jgi:hypothetical protein
MALRLLISAENEKQKMGLIEISSQASSPGSLGWNNEFHQSVDEMTRN